MGERPIYGGLTLWRKYPSHCCPLCGEPVGWLGRAFAVVFGTQMHGCDFKNVMHPQSVEEDRQRHDPSHI